MGKPDESGSLNLKLSGVIETLCEEFGDSGGAILLHGKDGDSSFTRIGTANLSPNEMRWMAVHLIEWALDTEREMMEADGQ